MGVAHPPSWQGRLVPRLSLTTLSRPQTYPHEVALAWMAVRGLQRSRFAFCLLILLLNIGVQLFLWLTFSLMSLPELGQQSATASLTQAGRDRKCACPSVEPAAAECETLKDKEEEEEVQKGGQAGKRSEEGDQEGVGEEERYLLVIIVLSSVRGQERRETIRRTWMKGYQDQDPPVLMRFTIGTLQQPTADLQDLMEEQSNHGDLIFLPDLKEDYTNLTLKVLQSFVWADKHLSFSYLMKCDDDTFIVMDTVLKELDGRLLGKSYYWGFFDGRATPKKTGKWTEKGNWFLCDHYLPYALGGGYVLSADLVHRIASNADGLQLYNNEDVSVGVWLSPYEAERRHDVRFNTEYVSRGCRNVYIVSHKQSVQDMLTKQRQLEINGVQCEREMQTRPSYEYNWGELPSKCCKRISTIP